MTDELTKREWDMIGKLVDYQRDTMASRLIHIEAIMDDKRPHFKKIQDRMHNAWDEMTTLSDKLDKIMGINND